jgi:glycosyltransferase involved in cell wall biosynthesis
MLKVMNLSSNDEMGGRFNGFDIHADLAELDVSTTLGSFWNQTSDEPWVFNVFPGQGRRILAEVVRAVEILSGRQNHFQWWSNSILKREEFVTADLVHLQVIHDHFLKFETVEKIAFEKPTLWTWHDLWPVTGHCIFPGECQKYKKACGNCPDLLSPLPVFRDRTAAEKARKSLQLSRTRLDIHVTTDWMVDRVKDRLTPGMHKLHKVPFGVNGEVFKASNRNEVREQLGLSSKDFVVFARATDDLRKGFIPLLRAMDEVSKDSDIVLLSVQQQGLAIRHTDKLRAIEFGWTNSPQQIRDLMSASDIFAMPSIDESFGMMALEAMSCSLPVVTSAGSATSEIVALAKLEVNHRNLEASLVEILKWCLANKSEIYDLGLSSRERAVTKFSYSDYLSNLVGLYREVVSRA